MSSIFWYPSEKKELEKKIDSLITSRFISINLDKKPNGLILPHAGYDFSGGVMGRAFYLVKDFPIKKAIILGPSHYVGFYGIRLMAKDITPLGKINLLDSPFNERGLQIEKVAYEHSVDNLIPFLQRLFPQIKILPLVVGELNFEDAKKIADRINSILDKESILLVSTDLSHFLDYNQAKKEDEKTIRIIESLSINQFEGLNACGVFPLIIVIYLCLMNNWKIKLIEYKNSGDTTGNTDSVVGYASFYF